ncbi:MAG: stage III sporulation protein AE [Clostridium sp.]
MMRIKRLTIIFFSVITLFMIFDTVFLQGNIKYSYAEEKTNLYKEDYNKKQININSDIGSKEQDDSISIGEKNEVNINDIGGKAKGQIEELYDYINKMKTDVELLQGLDPIDYINTFISEGKGNISFDTVMKAVLSLFFKEVKSVLTLVISIVTIAILCALLKNLQDAFTNESISQVAFYACYAIVIIILSKSFIISISVAQNVIIDISNFMNALLPILVTMIGLAGGITQAAAMDPFVLGSVILIPKIYTTIIIPMILMGFVLEFANNISEEHKITNLCKLFKKCILWFQGIILTAFIALLTIRGITSNTMDAVTLKTTKFAVDNFIPIVGKTFSDAITSVAGYSLIIKNAVSSIGLIVLLFILLYPILKLVLMTFIYKISSALIEPVSDSRITKSLESAGDSMVLIISCVLTVSLMFFILIAIMAQAGSFVVGG